jgi:cytochrome c oxidase subunit IV
MIIPKRTYLWVAAMLFVLLVLTIAMAYVDLGQFNIIVAMTIAIVKAVLVVLFFMHVRYSSKVTWVFASAGFFWLLILFILTMSDYATR